MRVAAKGARNARFGLAGGYFVYLVNCHRNSGLEASALGLKVVSFAASFTLLGTDFVYALRSGNRSVFIGDLASFGVGILPFGGWANKATQLQPGGRAMSLLERKLQERTIDTFQGFNVTINYPVPCK